MKAHCARTHLPQGCNDAKKKWKGRPSCHALAFDAIRKCSLVCIESDVRYIHTQYNVQLPTGNCSVGFVMTNPCPRIVRFSRCWGVFYDGMTSQCER